MAAKKKQRKQTRNQMFATVNLPVEIHAEVRAFAGMIPKASIASLLVASWKCYKPSAEKQAEAAR